MIRLPYPASKSSTSLLFSSGEKNLDSIASILLAIQQYILIYFEVCVHRKMSQKVSCQASIQKERGRDSTIIVHHTEMGPKLLSSRGGPQPTTISSADIGRRQRQDRREGSPARWLAQGSTRTARHLARFLYAYDTKKGICKGQQHEHDGKGVPVMKKLEGGGGGYCCPITKNTQPSTMHYKKP